MADECNACVRIVTALLNQKGSRAQHLLKSIGSSGELTAAEDGVHVQIPSNSKATVLLSRWTKVSKSAVPQPQLPPITALDTLSITCRRCSDTGPEGSARAFVFGPTPLQIVLCTNRLSLMNSEAIETALIHELIHIYDFRTRRMNLQDCHQLAYTEVRAAREGECRAAWWPASCVKERALTSTNIMFGEGGKACIRAVFETAMHDNAPFTPQSSVTEPSTNSNIQHASDR
jgi:Peptidase M76 family